MGQVGPPVQTSFGFHVIKVLEIREGGRKPVKDVAPQIRAKLFAEHLEEMRVVLGSRWLNTRIWWNSRGRLTRSAYLGDPAA